jgi:hypothetical protein
LDRQVRRAAAAVGLSACLALLAGSASAASSGQRVAPRDPITAIAAACLGNDPTDHVYHPVRLQLIEPCKTASGTVVHIKLEGDGDYHVQLALDPGQPGLLNSENRAHQGGNLVLEIVCAGKVSQQDAKATCKGYHSPIAIPKKGDHIMVTGPHILDTQNPGHHWMEIHPVFNLQFTPGPAQPHGPRHH